MISIIENNKNRLIIKKYPVEYWLAFIILAIIITIFNCQVFWLAQTYSSLTCTKGWLNTTNCEIKESSLLNKDLYHKTIKNIHKPKGVLNNGTIWLDTEIDIIHNQIRNIYYPSNRFLGFYSISVHRFYWQASQEVKKIDDFIHNRNNLKTLILIRKISFLFNMLLLLLPLTIAIPIILILVQPIDTYIFDVKQNSLVARSNILSIVEEKTYPLDQLNIISLQTTDNNKSSSIILKVDEQKLATFNNFKNTLEALNLFNLLKQYIK